MTTKQLLWLLAGAVLTAFSRGKGSIPLAAWLAPICLLRFAHLQSYRLRFFMIWPAIFAAIAVANVGVMPISGAPYFALTAVIATSAIVPYLADRLIGDRISGFAASLVFPAAWVATDYVTSFLGRGTWGDIAYTQTGNLPLMQLASVTGVYGIAFVIVWCASAINWACDRDFSGETVRNGLLVYAGAFAMVMLGGAARLALAGTDAKSVRAAAISTPNDIFATGEKTCILEGKPVAAQEEKVARLQSWFLDNTRREAQAGAKIVVWPEISLLVNASDEAIFIERARRVAAEGRIYLLMGMATMTPGASRPMQNKAILLDPEGRAVFSYEKHILVPGWEASLANPGDGHMPIATTPFGRVTTAICYEGDFPRHIRQAGRQAADVLLLPANDWVTIKEIHLRMASVRAIENGLSLIRATSNGMSAVVDPYGRTVAITDHFSPEARILVAQIPLMRVTTIYARVGDLFAWCCIALLALSWAAQWAVFANLRFVEN